MRYAERRSGRAVGRDRQLQQPWYVGLPLPYPAARRVRSRNVRDGDGTGGEISDMSVIASETTAVETARRWATRILGIPLELKLLGANLIIVAIAVVVMWTQFSIAPIRAEGVAILFMSLAVAAGVNFALVKLALKPVKDLELTAKRVSQGRFGERVPPSAVADRSLVHLANTMNEM